MSKIVFKSQAIARDFVVQAKNRIVDVDVIQGLDADRFPTMQFKIGAKSVFVRISTDFERSQEDGHVDGLGLPQNVYSPHKIELIQESAGGTIIPDPTTLNMRLQVANLCSQQGMKFFVKEAEAVEDAADYDAAIALNPVVVAEIRSDDINPLTSQM